MKIVKILFSGLAWMWLAASPFPAIIGLASESTGNAPLIENAIELPAAFPNVELRIEMRSARVPDIVEFLNTEIKHKTGSNGVWVVTDIPDHPSELHFTHADAVVSVEQFLLKLRDATGIQLTITNEGQVAISAPVSMPQDAWDPIAQRLRWPRDVNAAYAGFTNELANCSALTIRYAGRLPLGDFVDFPEEISIRDPYDLGRIRNLFGPGDFFYDPMATASIRRGGKLMTRDILLFFTTKGHIGSLVHDRTLTISGGTVFESANPAFRDHLLRTLGFEPRMDPRP